jgi:1-acyl-sn-glycerol-3-phosphate acyltransferase
VIVANHQSNYDLFVLANVVPRRTVCHRQEEPEMGAAVRPIVLAGNVLIDRKNALSGTQAMQTTTRVLQDDTSIWVFPEGTRNPGEQLLPFKKGAFHMAIEAGVPIVPVCVSRYARRMSLNSWRQRTVMRSLPPIATRHDPAGPARADRAVPGADAAVHRPHGKRTGPTGCSSARTAQAVPCSTE